MRESLVKLSGLLKSVPKMVTGVVRTRKKWARHLHYRTKRLLEKI